MRPHRLKLIVSLFLTLATLAIYWQVKHHDFVDFDDDVYVTENRHVQAGLTPESVVWAFTTTDAGFWHPLTWMSHMLDCQLYGLNSAGHHFTSLLLHVANTLLLFLVLARMTGALWSSAFVAALFALHPLHVESVAWVAERKDVLSTLFWMLTMGAYVYYTERPVLSRYAFVLLSFTLGLMAKSMLVSLPFVLLLLDYWPLGRFRVEQRASIFRLFLEKAPLFALTVLFCVLTFFAEQKFGVLAPLEGVPVKMRMANALVSYISYIGKMIWPKHLTMYYPLSETIPIWKALGAGFLLMCLSAVFVRTRRRSPYLMVGWLWYLGTLVPVIGIVHIGGHAMADRYTYVPLIGLFIVVTWGTQDILGQFKYRRSVLSTLAGIFLIILMMCTWSQVRYWKNTVTLERRAVDVTDSYKAHYNLGLALMIEGDLEEAITHYLRAIEIKPDYAVALNNLGLALMWQGKLDEAIDRYSQALRINSSFPEAYYNLGLAFMRQGRRDEAVSQYRKALQLKPHYPRARKALGIALGQQLPHGQRRTLMLQHP